MPISFEQPAPVGADVAEGLGFYQQMQREQELGMRRAQFQAAQQQHADALAMQAAQMGQQAYQFEASQQPSGRDVFHAQVQQQQSEQQFNQALQLHQAQLTQSEQMRMQRLEQTISEIQTARDNNEITPEVARDAIVQARTGLDLLQRRHAEAGVQAQQIAIEQARQHLRVTTQMEQERSAFMARSLADRTSMVPDPRILAEVQADHQRDFPSLWDNPNLDPAVEQRRNDMINSEVAARGGMRRYTEIRPGEYHLEEVRPDPNELTRHERLDLQRRNEADVRADVQHQRWIPPTPPATLTTQAQKDDFQERAIQAEAERRMRAQEGRAGQRRWGGSRPEAGPRAGPRNLNDALDQIFPGGSTPQQEQQPQEVISGGLEALRAANVPERSQAFVHTYPERNEAIQLLRIRQSQPWTPQQRARFRAIQAFAASRADAIREGSAEAGVSDQVRRDRESYWRYLAQQMQPFLER